MKKTISGSPEAEKWFAEKNRRRENRREFWRSFWNGVEKLVNFLGEKAVPVIGCVVLAVMIIVGSLSGLDYFIQKEKAKHHEDSQDSAINGLEFESKIMRMCREMDVEQNESRSRDIADLQARVEKLEPPKTNQVWTIHTSGNGGFGAAAYFTNMNTRITNGWVWRNASQAGE